MNTPSFIKVKDNSYVFANDGTFKFYVPEKYFSNKLAEFSGECINLFGMLSYAIFDKNDKVIGKLRTFKFPISFLTKPDEIEIAKGITLTNNTNIAGKTNVTDTIPEGTALIDETGSILLTPLKLALTFITSFPDF